MACNHTHQPHTESTQLQPQGGDQRTPSTPRRGAWGLSGRPEEAGEARPTGVLRHEGECEAEGGAP